MIDRLRASLSELMLISGHEDRVRRHIARRLAHADIENHTDRLGNLITTFKGDPAAPSVMVFAHMDSLGFFLRKIEADGLIAVERMGGVSERAMASQAVLLCVGEGRHVAGVLANKAHHATTPEEKYHVVKTPDIRIDTGHASKAAVEAAGIRIGTPVVYRPQVLPLGGAASPAPLSMTGPVAPCSSSLPKPSPSVKLAPPSTSSSPFRRSSICAALRWRPKC